ncbi:electron transfer flavoprotein subunit alpha [Parasutterella secunda]|uniref:electron transfer flavoprotein subunit alpha/FixB family protein n=1 Tax=Parasutterella secunda TaxID=626947 RepID=UPI0003378D22|nr:FAD-binding protein [Parasutterella secunda]CDE77128.1 electron transfer flavoprotein subunit alpha [Sutterella sp. CAG:521]HIR21151.1 electron transfer flavoprotein subunit alpha [Candidatus Aphodousia faecalis]MCL1597211.1 electron transfer flavoprotein subunit alpha [Parasutterella secunda]MCR8920921.1 FAD-binding protein [Parasutterella secunda]MDM8088194.1 FAD-binding protein [Parasutterella secunda]
MRALVIGEVNAAGIKPTAASLVTAAVKAAGVTDMLLLGQGQSAQDVAKTFSGVETVFVNPADGENILTESLSKAVVALVKEHGYSHVFFEASSMGKSVMPRVAALLDVAPLSDVTAVIDAQTYVRPIFAGSIEVTLKDEEPVIVASIRATAFDACEKNGQAQIVMNAPFPETMRTRKVSFEAVKTDRPALQGARIVVAGGRGLEDEEGFKKLAQLADRLGAAIGATRAVVDLGLCPNDWQVGQTGKIIAPDLYIAIGISGAMQHIAGIKDAKVVVAINNDPEAPIFEVADYGLVMDAKAGIDELLKELN